MAKQRRPRWLHSMDRHPTPHRRDTHPARKRRDFHDELEISNDKILARSMIQQIYLSNQDEAQAKTEWFEAVDKSCQKQSDKIAVLKVHREFSINFMKLQQLLKSFDSYWEHVRYLYLNQHLTELFQTHNTVYKGRITAEKWMFTYKQHCMVHWVDVGKRLMKIHVNVGKDFITPPIIEPDEWNEHTRIEREQRDDDDDGDDDDDDDDETTTAPSGAQPINSLRDKFTKKYSKLKPHKAPKPLHIFTINDSNKIYHFMSQQNKAGAGCAIDDAFSSHTWGDGAGIDPTDPMKSIKTINGSICSGSGGNSGGGSGVRVDMRPVPSCVPVRVQIDLEQKKRVDIRQEITNIRDLIQIAKDYPDDPTVEYNISVKKIHAIVEPLKQLDDMIGLKELKETLVDQLLYYIQGFHIPKEGLVDVLEASKDTSKDSKDNNDSKNIEDTEKSSSDAHGVTVASGAGAVASAGTGNNVPHSVNPFLMPLNFATVDDPAPSYQQTRFSKGASGSGSISSWIKSNPFADPPKSKQNQNSNEFLHMVIYGPPGTGKTDVAKIIGDIFCRLGVLSGNKFKKATRADMIAEYLGQTAVKTRKLIENSLGGVLFIDEAYALGNTEKRDMFSKECIDTLNECLSDLRDDLMVIIAGYEKELKESFFSHNPGLESRFVWRYRLTPYTSDELHEIFNKKARENGWCIHSDDETKIERWFEVHYEKFPSFGRDMETLFSKVKIAHSRRVFTLPAEEHRYLRLVDFEAGLKRFVAHQGGNMEEKEMKKQIMRTMFI